MKIHSKRGILLDQNVHKNLWKVSIRIHPITPQKFAFYDSKNSAIPKKINKNKNAISEIFSPQCE